MKKLKAFTLIEVIIIMALTGFIVLLSGSVLFLIYSNFETSSRSLYLKTDNIQFLTNLKGDMFYSNRVILNKDSIFFTFDDRVVKYKSYEGGIIRNHEIMTDTFKIEPFKSKFYLDGTRVDSGLIDRWLIHTETEEFIININKEYAADLFFETQDSFW